MNPFYNVRITLLAGILVIIAVQALHSQSVFHSRYGSSYFDRARKVIETNDGNFVLVGQTNGFGSAGNAFIMKVDTEGEMLWLVDYAGINLDELYDVLEMPDGTLLMCGSTMSYGAGNVDGFVMKTDSEGNAIWTKVIGGTSGEFLYSIGLGTEGEIYVGGYANVYFEDEFNPGYAQGVLAGRLDGDGNVVWLRWFDNWSPMGDAFYVDLVALASGGFAVTMPYPIQVVRFSGEGDVVYSSQPLSIPGISISSGNTLTEDAGGNILLYTTAFGLNTNAQSADACVIRMDENGDFVSAFTYGGTYTDWARSIAPTSDGGATILMYSNSAGNGDYDASLVRLDSQGAVLWAKAYGEAWQERPWRAAQTTDGGFIFTGQTWSEGASSDSAKVHLVKTDGQGNTSCNAVEWTPIVIPHTAEFGQGSAPIELTLDEVFINWTPQVRQFYHSDLCNVLSSENAADNGQFSLYPNPAFNQVYIESNTQLKHATALLHNTSGQLVATYTGLGGYQAVLERGHLPAGLYFLTVLNDGTARRGMKVVFYN